MKHIPLDLKVHCYKSLHFFSDKTKYIKHIQPKDPKNNLLAIKLN